MKKMSLLLVGVVVLGLSIPTFAAEAINWVEWHKNRIESQKVLIDARVEAGLISQAQADLWKQTMEARQEAIEGNPEAFAPGTGLYGPVLRQDVNTGFSNRGMHRGGFGGGRGMMGGGFAPMMFAK